MSTIKSFIKEVVARVGGDTAEVIAQKNYRKATSAIQSQIAALNAKEVDDEQAVDAAQEALDNAKFPTSLITDNKTYVSNIQHYHNKLKDAEATLQATRDSIYFFETLQGDFDYES